jgi:type I restriction enzyme S subunit
MKEDWEEIIYKDAVYKISTSKQKLKQKQYLKSGLIPIVDQGQDLIGGYTNDENRVIECDLPVLVFGDHTKITKLIDFKFAPGADGTKILEPSKFVLPEYLSILTKVLTFKIKDNGYARHYQHIEKELLPLAPLTIQRAIVSKTEELFSDLDNGIANFKKAQEQLKVYRQAVLKKAFEGELTKEWRAKQTHLPTAEELLKQIKEERQNHYNQQIEDWKKAVKEWEKNGKKGSKPTKPQNLASYPEIEQSESLPILNLGELVSQISIKLMPDDAPDMPFIGMDCLEKNALKPHFTYKFSEFKSAGNWFNVNHILYGRMRPYLNKVYHAEYEGVASGEFIIMETTKSILPQYLKLILHQQDFVHWSNRQSSGDKPRVKFEQIALYNITVPTVNEQTQIVQEIESRLSVCDKMEQSINESIEKAEALRQSILKKAFEGKLLGEAEIAQCKQAADYEPAGELLKKIQAEKLAKEQEKKKSTVNLPAGKAGKKSKK